MRISINTCLNMLCHLPMFEISHKIFSQNIHLIFIAETLRKHPVAANLRRIATKPYKVPGTEYIIPKGMRIIVPIYAIHHDETLFPNSDRFIPERFSEDIPAHAFIPFGAGKYTLHLLSIILSLFVGFHEWCTIKFVFSSCFFIRRSTEMYGLSFCRTSDYHNTGVTIENV